MTNLNRDKLVGGIITVFLIGIPLAIFFGPIALGVFLVTLPIGLMRKKEPPKKVDKQKQVDEIITVVQPITTSKK